MAPPALPEASLIIAPNKKGGTGGGNNKIRRRPVFRPGQSPSKRHTPDNNNKKAAASGKGHPKEVESEKTNNNNAIDNNDNNVVEEELQKNDIDLETAKTGDEKATDNQPSEEAAKSMAALKKAPTNPKSSPGKAIASPTKETAASVRTNEPKTVAAASTRKKAPQKAKGKAIAPTRRTPRKRKSTELVVGSSRAQTAGKAKQGRTTRSSKRYKRNYNDSTSATYHDGGTILPPLDGPPPVGTGTEMAALVNIPNLPRPKEGEVPLNKFCSQFKARRRSIPKEEAQRKKQEEEKEKDRKQQQQQQQAAAAAAASQPEVDEEPSAGPVVQIIDGEIVLEEASMVVHGASGRRGTLNEEEYAVVEEDDNVAIVKASYASFVKRTRTKQWSVEETKLFYEALRQVGTDFVVMAEFYPGRDRKQLKRKYQREVARNPKLVELALHPSQRKPLDLTVFEVDPKDVQEHVQVRKQREKEEVEAAKAKAAKQEQEAKEAAENAAKNKENNNSNQDDGDNDEEDGMEVVFEDDDDDHVVDVTHKARATATTPTTSMEKQEMEATKSISSSSLWPDETQAEEENAQNEDGEAMEDDPMMMMNEFSEAYDEGKDAARDETTADGHATEKEPVLSLVPSANKKKALAKKPKFRRPAKKKR